MVLQGIADRQPALSFPAGPGKRMTTDTILILLGALVVFSYIFDLFAKRARVPSVLLLLLLGMGLRWLSDAFGITWFDPDPLLPGLGTVGLILIVLDGALGLEYTPRNRPLILRSLYSALLGLVLTSLAFMYLFHALTAAPFSVCLANAVPLGVISSAVAIPSAEGLSRDHRSFVIYESSISDILGVIFFNLFSTGVPLSVGRFGGAAFDLVLVVLISLVSCLVLLWLLSRSTHHVRVFLILSLLVIIYGIGKSLHLSSLVIILAFGLFVANLDQIPIPWLRRLADYPRASSDKVLLHSLTSESTFIVRTFFFVLFGYSITISSMLRPSVWLVVAGCLALLYLLRAIVLRVTDVDVTSELLVLAPRGLITVLLFLSLPDEMMLPLVDKGFVVSIVLGTALVMGAVLPLNGRRRKLEPDR